MDSGLHHWAGTSNLLPQSSGEMLGSSQDSPAAPGWYGNIPNTPARGLSHTTPSSLSLPAGVTDQQSRGTHSGSALPPPAPPAPVTTAQPRPSALLRCIHNKGHVPWRSRSSPLPLRTLQGHFPGFCLPRAGESAAGGHTLVVFTLLPLLQLQPERSGSTLHSSPSRHGSIWHHHFCSTMEAGGEEASAAGLRRGVRRVPALPAVGPWQEVQPLSPAQPAFAATLPRSCSAPAWPRSEPVFSRYPR